MDFKRSFLRSVLVKDPLALGDDFGPEDLLKMEEQFPSLFNGIPDLSEFDSNKKAKENPVISTIKAEKGRLIKPTTVTTLTTVAADKKLINNKSKTIKKYTNVNISSKGFAQPIGCTKARCKAHHQQQVQEIKVEEPKLKPSAPEENFFKRPSENLKFPSMKSQYLRVNYPHKIVSKKIISEKSPYEEPLLENYVKYWISNNNSSRKNQYLRKRKKKSLHVHTNNKIQKGIKNSYNIIGDEKLKQGQIQTTVTSSTNDDDIKIEAPKQKFLTKILANYYKKRGLQGFGDKNESRQDDTTFLENSLSELSEDEYLVEEKEEQEETNAKKKLNANTQKGIPLFTAKYKTGKFNEIGQSMDDLSTTTSTLTEFTDEIICMSIDKFIKKNKEDKEGETLQNDIMEKIKTSLVTDNKEILEKIAEEMIMAQVLRFFKANKIDVGVGTDSSFRQEEVCKQNNNYEIDKIESESVKTPDLTPPQSIKSKRGKKVQENAINIEDEIITPEKTLSHHSIERAAKHSKSLHDTNLEATDCSELSDFIFSQDNEDNLKRKLNAADKNKIKKSAEDEIEEIETPKLTLSSMSDSFLSDKPSTISASIHTPIKTHSSSIEQKKSFDENKNEVIKKPLSKQVSFCEGYESLENNTLKSIPEALDESEQIMTSKILSILENLSFETEISEGEIVCSSLIKSPGEMSHSLNFSPGICLEKSFLESDSIFSQGEA